MEQTKSFIRGLENPGALININKKELIAYKKQKVKAREIIELKEEVSELKSLVKQLLEKNK